MGTAIEALDGFTSQERVLIDGWAGDGRKAIRVLLDGGVLTYVVEAWDSRERHAEPRTLTVTPHKDIAAHVYESFDGSFRPWASAWQPRGLNDTDNDGKTIRVYAVGTTIEDCINGFADSLGRPGAADIEVSDKRQGGWSARCTVDGTGFKAWGFHVPGGVVMTSWQ